MKILNVFNTFTNNTNDIKTQMMSRERNTEKLNNKYGIILKTGIANLERESMENSLQIIKMDHSYRTLLSTRLKFDVGKVVTPVENCFD